MKNYLKYKNWYKNANIKIKKEYGKDSVLFSGLIASTSPRFSIKRNINTAKAIYQDFKKEDKKTFVKNAIENKQDFLKRYKIINSHFNNIIRILNFNYDDKKIPILSGLKVNSFFQNLIGNYEAVTLDIWMIRYFNYNKAYLTIRPYKIFTRIIRKLAEKENLKPCELQAILWSKIRLEHGFKPINFVRFI